MIKICSCLSLIAILSYATPWLSDLPISRESLVFISLLFGVILNLLGYELGAELAFRRTERRLNDRVSALERNMDS